MKKMNRLVSSRFRHFFISLRTGVRREVRTSELRLRTLVSLYSGL